ncbi:hypothetical protein ACFQQB_38430 [Nonomuraea rubra]|uniref:hypothetical protein n=1 Tax=Nonomuraea rubra TaxID=46180 RepID=UPI003614236A
MSSVARGSSPGTRCRRSASAASRRARSSDGLEPDSRRPRSAPASTPAVAGRLRGSSSSVAITISSRRGSTSSLYLLGGSSGRLKREKE